MPIRIHTELTMISIDGILWMRQATFGGINISYVYQNRH